MPEADDLTITRVPRTGSRSSRRLTRADRRRSRARGRRIAAVAISGLLTVFLLFAGWAGFTYWSLSEKIKPSRDEADAVAAVLTPKDMVRAPEEPVWVLLLGTDARPGESAARSDTIILARLDAAEKQITMLSIPRDTRVNIPGYGVNKVNAASAYGGTALMIQTVQEITGLPVDHYMQIDFEAFKEAVDSMGGIRLNIERPINDLKASNYDREAARIEAGDQVLDGAKALTFVRSRAFADGDYTRMRNQQRFIIEFIKQSLNTANIGRLPSIASSLAGHMDTDMSVRELMELAQVFNGLDTEAMRGYTVPSTTGTIGGVSYVLPDEVALRRLAGAIEAGEQPDIEGGQEAVMDFEIALVNTTDVDGVARRMGATLEDLGFKVGRLVNNPSAAGGRSVVLYRRDQHAEEAHLVAHTLGDWPVVHDTSSATSRLGDVVVVVGTARAGSGDRQVPEL